MGKISKSNFEPTFFTKPQVHLGVDIKAYPQTTESKTDLGLEIHVNHKKGNIVKFKKCN